MSWRRTLKAGRYTKSETALTRTRSRQVLLEKPPRVRPPALRDRFGRAGDDDFAAGMAAFRSEVDDVVGGLDHVHVVLDEQHGVAVTGLSRPEAGRGNRALVAEGCAEMLGPGTYRLSRLSAPGPEPALYSLASA